MGTGRGLWVKRGEKGGIWAGAWGPGRVRFCVLEGDSESWKGILGKKRRKRRDLGGGLGSWKGIVGTGRVRFWVQVGVDFGSWKGWILGMVSVSS